MRSALARIVLGVGVAGAVAGCGRKRMADAPNPTSELAAFGGAPAAAPATLDSGSPAAGGDADRRLAILEERVHFDFDRWTLTLKAQSVLTAKAEVLVSSPAVTLRIEGHADERGSDEYNLVLSNKRASEVKRYLTGLGIDPSRLETMGYGEERPLVERSDEPAWLLNRRAEFRVTGNLTPR